MIFVDLLIILFIVVFIVDTCLAWKFVSGIVSLILTKKWRTDSPIRPFSCSLCSTFWAGLIYIIVCGAFSVLNLGYLCLLAFLTPLTNEIMYFISDNLIKIFNKRIK